MNKDKKHISSIVSDIQNGKSISKEKIEKMLLDYDTAQDKYSFLDFLYKKLMEPRDTVTVGVNLFYRHVKDYIKDRQADFLKKMNDTPKDQKTAYGFHQKNKEWINEKWKEVRKGEPSDRQADIKVMDLYKERFELSISTSQIQRFTGR